MSTHFAASNIANILKNKAQNETEKALLREVFKMADKNKDGMLDYDECVRMLRAKGVKIKDEEIRAIFDKADKNKDR